MERSARALNALQMKWWGNAGGCTRDSDEEKVVLLEPRLKSLREVVVELRFNATAGCRYYRSFTVL